jgi:hypothetical protein
MSKRARITLEPEEETKPEQAEEAAPLPETEPRAQNDHAAAEDYSSELSAPARKTPGVGTIFKVIFAGLAVASVVLLWKNRRP